MAKNVDTVIYYGSSGESRFSAEPTWLTDAIEGFLIWFDDSSGMVMVGHNQVRPGDYIVRKNRVITVERR